MGAVLSFFFFVHFLFVQICWTQNNDFNTVCIHTNVNRCAFEIQRIRFVCQVAIAKPIFSNFLGEFLLQYNEEREKQESLESFIIGGVYRISILTE